MATARLRTGRARDAKKPPPVTSYHHGDLRQSLVRAGCELLKEKGVTAFSLREVARRSGVSQAAPYRHFPDKASLLAAVAAEGFRGLSHAMTRSAADMDDKKNRFRALGFGYIRFAIENPSMLRLMFGAEMGNKCDYPELQQAASESYRILSDSADQIASDPGPKGNNTTALAAWSMVHGLSQLLIDGQVAAREGEELEALIVRVISKLRA